MPAEGLMRFKSGEKNDFYVVITGQVAPKPIAYDQGYDA